MYYERKKYTIVYTEAKDGILADLSWVGDSLEILEPKNWRLSNKKLVRNANYHGIAVTLTESLNFVGEAKDVLEYILNKTGINSDLKLIVEIANQQTDILEIDYEGWFDFKTYDISENEFSIKLSSDPLTELFKAKQSSKVEIERVTDLKDNAISPIKLISIFTEGRDLFQTSQCIENDDSRDKIAVTSVLSENAFAAQNIPTIIKYKDDENVHSTLAKGRGGFGTNHDNFTGDVGSTFYGVNDFDRTLNIDIDVDRDFFIESNDAGTVWLRVYVYKYQNGLNFDFKERVLDVNGNSILWEGSSGATKMNFKTSIKTELLFDESLELRYDLFAELNNGGIVACGVGRFVNFSDEPDYEDITNKVGILISEESSRAETNTPGVMGYELVEKICQISFSSEFESTTLGRQELGIYSSDGFLSQTAFAHGMWFRGMNSSMEKFKTMSTSFKDIYNSINVISPIGIEIGNGKIKLEDIDYFYQKHVSLNLGEVTKLKIKPDLVNMHSTINVGYEKAGGYEERQGLDEYNRATEYDNPLRIDSVLNLVAKVRADGYGLETVRREISDLTEDSKFDDHIWALDVHKLVGQTETWKISNWTKRFEKAPTSVFSPDTALNLWFSPINILLRHGRWLKSSLLKNLNQYISFNNSEGNSKITTQQIGGIEYSQDDKILVNDLERPILNGKIAEFEAPVKFLDLVGKTNNVSNFYGKTVFTFKGVQYSGYLYSVSIKNRIGTFSLKLTS